MKDTIVTPHMPRQPTQDTPTAELTVMEEPLRLKVFEVDHTEAAKVQKVGGQVIRNLSVNEVLREAIHAGLPIVLRKYEALAKTAKETQ